MGAGHLDSGSCKCWRGIISGGEVSPESGRHRVQLDANNAASVTLHLAFYIHIKKMTNIRYETRFILGSEYVL